MIVRYDDIPASDITTVDAIPCTTALRTVIDLAPEVEPGPKLATLRALRHGGRSAFTVIFPVAGLTAAETRRAIEAGPNCALRSGYSSLLGSAGFVEIEECDLTADYLATATRKGGDNGRIDDPRPVMRDAQFVVWHRVCTEKILAGSWCRRP